MSVRVTARLGWDSSSYAQESFYSPFDATVVQRLKNAGASIAGKTNCDEFGMG